MGNTFWSMFPSRPRTLMRPITAATFRLSTTGRANGNAISIGDAEQGVVHGILVNDWDGDHHDELLIAGFLGVHCYKYNPEGRWSRTEITRGDPQPWPKSGTSDIAIGTLNGERFLASIEPWHGNQVVVYRQSCAAAPNGEWRREVIDATLLDGHVMLTADLDGDGSDEIVAGYRGQPYGLNLYKHDGAKWVCKPIDAGGISAAGCVIADLDGDGRLDIACIGQATHNLKMYWNR